MRPVYGCEPDALTYNYLVHGLSAQGRTRNAREVFEEMRAKGLSRRSRCATHSSVLWRWQGRLGEAERVMWDMARVGRVVDDNTRRVVVAELWRSGRRDDADRVEREMEERGIVGGAERRVLLRSLHDEFGYDDLDVDDRGQSTRWGQGKAW
ncbi:hypothetical protein E2562_021212 [Oryza meyeriana var. granulata]|uniref:Pentacotripeptide-repeat region of PRORP domain-containing protein n=1 Tax=Oryza meyeriana var. granulata TaxID=110450 RepID=A0A6G1DZQ4_9ORYZ|nr:hypothetical protein E2562_021212 [Oryza meyeriana var. granulata]